MLVAGLTRAPLALQRATGQTEAPLLALPWWAPVALLPVVATVLVVVAVESSLGRSEQLGEVLRLGGT